MVADGLGFALQNRGELFALDARHANVYAPASGRSTRSSRRSSPRTASRWLSFGVMGGDMQPQGHVQVSST